MDAVEVPSLKEIQKRKAAQREDEIKKLDKMKNPKTNMKKVEACFDVDTIRDRLRPIGLDLYPINLDRDLQDVMVPREFISSIYGGGLQCAWVNVAKKTQKRLNNSKFSWTLF
ncbi:hypothetical protein H0H93_001464 [Arthromyces matolae]|nr:hypothetical protein H0H93_001464 [Arthromyces matolae]